MIPESTEVHTYPGIEAIYFLKDIAVDYLKKLQQMAELTLDSGDPVIQKNCADDMILIGSLSKQEIQKCVRYLCKNPAIEGSLRSQALTSEEKILHVIKERKFALVTHRNLTALNQNLESHRI